MNTTTTEPPKPFETTLHCIRWGCSAMGRLLVHPSSSPNVHGITPRDGWLFYALGFPRAIDLGLCPEHHAFTIDGDPTLSVTVTRHDHKGLVFTLSDAEGVIGGAYFPNNTLEVSFGPGEVSEQLRAAGARLAAVIDFVKRPA